MAARSMIGRQQQSPAQQEALDALRRARHLWWVSATGETWRERMLAKVRLPRAERDRDAAADRLFGFSQDAP